MPNMGETNNEKEPIVYLHYYTGTADYFIYEYDKQDTVYGMVRMNVFPALTEYKTFNLTSLKNTQNIKLDFSWIPVRIPKVPVTSFS
jgi:hypothetical protein